MPEYLAPGVYVEEVSFRAKSIEGVSTSVAGFIGPTRYGPTEGPPELLTSFLDFERIYGGVDPLELGGESQANYMAHAVRAFFDNGGSKLYVTRVYEPTDPADANDGKASLTLPGSPPVVTLRARFSGVLGEMRIVLALRTTPNLLVADPIQPTVVSRVSGIREHDVVYIKEALGSAGLVPEGLYDVIREGDTLAFRSASGTVVRLNQINPQMVRFHRLTVSVRVRRPERFGDEQLWTDLSPHPSSRNAITSLFTQEPSSRQQYLTIPFAIETQQELSSGAQLLVWLFGTSFVTNVVSRSLATDAELRNQSPPQTRPTPAELEVAYTLDQGHGGTNGSDGTLPTAEAYRGREMERDGPSGQVRQGTGLETFVDVDEISIVAAPGYSFNYINNPQRADQIVQYLITHCEIRMRYRVAVLDSPNDQVLSEVQEFRGKFDSTYAALYYPWITILDPMDPDGRREIVVPPSGFVAGIYARTDVLHGVFKAPANEVALGGIDLEILLNKPQQDILNPLGINCFRFFEGRGFRLWGARTISSDPEFKYISVRRYFVYLEHSIDKGTQWAVFENNDERLWANVRQTVTDFLFNEWRNGALMGTKPEEAFFVRCDRSTMTQNDLDNGRLICLIGVAVVKPAEFVIFRIGQFTADRKT